MREVIDPRKCYRGIMPIPLLVTLVSYNDSKRDNLTTVSFAGQVSEKKVYVALRPTRHVCRVFSESLTRSPAVFGINYLYADQVEIADYCGVASGRDTDKFKETGLNVGRVNTNTHFNVPLVKESPLSLACRLEDMHVSGTHAVFFAEVQAIVKRQGAIPKFLMHETTSYFSTDNLPLGPVFEIGKKMVRRGRK